MVEMYYHTRINLFRHGQGRPYERVDTEFLRGTRSIESAEDGVLSCMGGLRHVGLKETDRIEVMSLPLRGFEEVFCFRVECVGNPGLLGISRIYSNKKVKNAVQYKEKD